MNFNQGWGPEDCPRLRGQLENKKIVALPLTLTQWTCFCNSTAVVETSLEVTLKLY